MNLQLNGAPRAVAEGSTVADAVASLTAAPTGVAVALNGEVIPRAEWPNIPLRDGDRVEILTASQGG